MEHELPESFFITASPDESCQMFVLEDEPPESFWAKVSHVIAWDDINNLSVVTIVYNGRLCHYEGWQPGMRFEYTDAFTGEVVYDGYFPEWDH